MKISQDEKNRILELHNRGKNINHEQINEGFFSDLWAGLKGIPQGFTYNRNLSKITTKVDELLKQSLKSESTIMDLQKLKSDLQNKSMSQPQKEHLIKIIDYLVQNQERNKKFLTDLRVAMKGQQ